MSLRVTGAGFFPILTDVVTVSYTHLDVYKRQLLSRVWGYEYYGGARTVDVHIRRLRAKLGEEHAYLIQTVRSVGYRFGQVAWHPGLAQRSGPGASAGAPATG